VAAPDGIWGTFILAQTPQAICHHHPPNDAGSVAKGFTTLTPSKSYAACKSSVRRNSRPAAFAAATIKASLPRQQIPHFGSRLFLRAGNLLRRSGTKFLQDLKSDSPWVAFHNSVRQA
jgi:hypothetical protein